MNPMPQGDFPSELKTLLSFPIEVQQRLLERVKCGEDDALEKMHRLLWKPLFSTSKEITKSHHDSEDIVQDALIYAN